MRRIIVHRYWQNTTRFVEPGVYNSNDPAIDGVAQYLIERGIAEVLHEDAPPSADETASDAPAEPRRSKRR